MTVTTVRPADAITQTIPRHVAPAVEAEPEAHITARIFLPTRLVGESYVGKHRRRWTLGATIAARAFGVAGILAATVAATLALTDGVMR